MTETAIWGAVGVIVAAVVGMFSARLTGKSTEKVKKIDIDAAAYERADGINAKLLQNLLGEVERLKKIREDDEKSLRERDERLDKIEAMLRQITREFRISINYIEADMLWQRRGSKPPKNPFPDELRQYIDPSLLAEHERQQPSPKKAP